MGIVPFSISAVGKEKMETQIVELLGRNRLTNDLLQSEIEVAIPLRDRGVDLIAYLDLVSKTHKFVACPIQMKAATKRTFSIDAKYSRIQGLIVAYVWNVAIPGESEIYAMLYPDALEIGRQMGYLNTDSWKKGNYVTTSPSKKLVELITTHRTTPGKWLGLLKSAANQAL